MLPKRPALGRGLDSLIAMDDAPARGTSAINDIEISRISPNPDQPRSLFDEESLEELSRSIRELGIIQPLSLRKTGPDTYQIIAGERRYRAAIMAGLTTVPAYIRTANDTELTEMALIENIQREDLNAIEIALTFKKLIEQYDLTQERLSERIGKKRTTIANFLRLLRLPAEVQLGLRDKRIDMGHARALLSIDDPKLQLRLYEEILRHGLSVRKVEDLIAEEVLFNILHLKQGSAVIYHTSALPIRSYTIRRKFMFLLVCPGFPPGQEAKFFKGPETGRRTGPPPRFGSSLLCQIS